MHPSNSANSAILTLCFYWSSKGHTRLQYIQLLAKSGSAKWPAQFRRIPASIDPPAERPRDRRIHKPKPRRAVRTTGSSNSKKVLPHKQALSNSGSFNQANHPAFSKENARCNGCPTTQCQRPSAPMGKEQGAQGPILPASSVFLRKRSRIAMTRIAKTTCAMSNPFSTL